MEPSILVLILVICVLAAFFAWLLGVWGKAQAIWPFALIGLILTGLGAALVLVTAYWWAPALESSATGGGRNLLTGLFILVPLVLGWGVELPGIMLTLAICIVGLGQTARKRTGWFWALLAGALLPILLSALTELLMPTIGQLRPPIGVYWALQQGTAAAPLIAAIVTAIYARRATARGRGGATLHLSLRQATT